MHKILDREIIDLLKVLIDKYANQSKNPKRSLHLLNKFFTLNDTYFHVEIKKNETIRTTDSVKSIEFRILNLSTVYVQKINIESVSFNKELYAFLNSIKKLNINKIILDLRDNAGGDLKNALLFLKIFGADKNVQLSFVDDGCIHMQIPELGKIDISNIVILVNDKTISAAELIALALKQLKNTVIVGKKTFGKSEIQCNKCISNLSVKYTIGKYIVNGIDISGTGIEPDIMVYDVCEEIDSLYEAINKSEASFVECVLFLQKGFKKLGLYEANVSGVYDLELINVVINYKVQNNMCKTDYITNTLIEQMYSDMKKIEDKQFKKALQFVGLEEEEYNGWF